MLEAYVTYPLRVPHLMAHRGRHQIPRLLRGGHCTLFFESVGNFPFGGRLFANERSARVQIIRSIRTSRFTHRGHAVRLLRLSEFLRHASPTASFMTRFSQPRTRNLEDYPFNQEVCTYRHIHPTRRTPHSKFVGLAFCHPVCFTDLSCRPGNISSLQHLSPVCPSASYPH